MALIDAWTGGALWLTGRIDPVEGGRGGAVFRVVRFAAAFGLFCTLGACSARQQGPTASPVLTRPATVAYGAAEAFPTPTGPVLQTAMVAPLPTPRPASTIVAGPSQPARGTIAAAPKSLATAMVGRSGSGLASWYGGRFHGRTTANGERFDMAAFTAAHRSFPLPSYVRVTNASNGRSIVVRVNDRGPFHGGRVIDVSQRTADVLGFSGLGVGNVKLDYIGQAPKALEDARRLLASYQEFGRPSAPAGMQVAGLTPVSDADLASGSSTAGAAYAVASAAVSTSVAVWSSSASAAAAGAQAALRGGAPGLPSYARSPSATAYAPPQPLLASVPEALSAPKRKRIVAPSEPALASATPELRAPVAAPVPVAAPSAAAARVAASFESFGGATSVRTGGSIMADALR